MKELLQIFKSPYVILGTVVVAVVIVLGVIAILLYLPVQQVSQTTPSAILTIFPGPTNTHAVPTPTITVYPTATSGIPPSPMPGMMGVGAVVQIYGTDGEGLNIRSDAGLDADVNFLGYDSEVFEVADGPQEADGFTWWYLKSPADGERNGWAAANYLSVMTDVVSE